MSFSCTKIIFFIASNCLWVMIRLVLRAVGQIGRDKQFTYESRRMSESRTLMVFDASHIPEVLRRTHFISAGGRFQEGMKDGLACI